MFRAVDEFLRSLLVTAMRWRCRDKAAHCTNRSADRPDGGTCSSEQLVPTRGIVQVWVAVAGVGTRCLAIGSGGEADGFHTLRAEPLLRRMAALTADGVPTALGKAPTEVGVQTAIGEAPTEVGTARSSLPRA